MHSSVGLLRLRRLCQIYEEYDIVRFINKVLSAGATKVYFVRQVVLATAAVGTWRTLALKLRVIRLGQRPHRPSRASFVVPSCFHEELHVSISAHGRG